MCDSRSAAARSGDDVPVTSSLERGWGELTSPDLDPSDLAQIEVLKGPQGTLYGADSLSGLIKYVTTDPSTSKFSGRVEVTGVDIPVGGAGYGVRVAVNVPLSDTFAVRFSGFVRHDPGYIDDVTTGERNFNSVTVYGGHAAALWQPSANFSVKLSALVQETHGIRDWSIPTPFSNPRWAPSTIRVYPARPNTTRKLNFTRPRWVGSWVAWTSYP
jgi:iron complex outermembrane receptor protein